MGRRTGRLWKALFGNALARNTAVIFSGNGLAMAIPFIAAPILTRLYTPADFAGFELFVKILSIFAVIASLRFELAIVLPKTESEAKSLSRLCLRIVFFATLVSALIVPFRHPVGGLFNNADLAALLPWLPVGVLLTGLYSIALQSATREERFRLISSNKVANAVANQGGKLGMGWISPGAFGLVAGHLLGMGASLAGLLRNKSVRSYFRRVPLSLQQTKNLARKYREFPLYNAPHALFDEGSRTFLFFVISVGYGELILGLFAFTFRYLRMPLVLLGTALSSVIYPRLSRMLNDGEVPRPLIAKTMAVFAVLGIFPFLVVFLFGPELFGFIFGDAWADSGRYARIMTPWLYLNFITSPVSILPTVLGKQKHFFLINLVGVSLALVAVFLLMTANFDFLPLLVVLSSAYSAIHLFLIVWFLRISKFKHTDISQKP